MFPDDVKYISFIVKNIIRNFPTLPTPSRKLPKHYSNIVCIINFILSRFLFIFNCTILTFEQFEGRAIKYMKEINQSRSKM